MKGFSIHSFIILGGDLFCQLDISNNLINEEFVYILKYILIQNNISFFLVYLKLSSDN